MESTTANVPLDVNVWMVYSPTVVTLPPVARGSLDEQDAGDEGEGDDEGAIVQFAAVSTLSVHDVTPYSTYPESHVGWHVEPLGRVSVQSPAAPFAGGTAASHALSLRTQRGGRRTIVWPMPRELV